jgi:cell division protein ZapA
MDDEGRVIPVEINGRRYPVRTALDAEYVVRLAAYVEERLRLAAEVTPDADGMRLAVLTALNLADEVFRCRESARAQGGEIAERTGQLEEMLDRILLTAG